MLFEPEGFLLEDTTLWDFPNRGKWATHTGVYPGNWSPYVPRNLLLRYSQPGDWVLDQFMGSGTTLVEAKLLDRNAVGIDINPQTVALAEKNLDFPYQGKSRIFTRQGDACNMSFLKNERIDFICTHPPYADIIRYSHNIAGDISLLSVEKFLFSMDNAAREAYRVLKQGRYCAVMMGDIRCHGNVIPLGFKVMNCFLNAGFKSKEIIIKKQHNCRSTPRWKNASRQFLMLAHEYIFVFLK